MSESTSWIARHPAFTYTAARFAIFCALLVVLWLVFHDVLVALVSAAILSSIISVLALRKQRDALSVSIATRAERASQRMAERAAVRGLVGRGTARGCQLRLRPGRALTARTAALRRGA